MKPSNSVKGFGNGFISKAERGLTQTVLVSHNGTPADQEPLGWTQQRLSEPVNTTKLGENREKLILPKTTKDFVMKDKTPPRRFKMSLESSKKSFRLPRNINKSSSMSTQTEIRMVERLSGQGFLKYSAEEDKRIKKL